MAEQTRKDPQGQPAAKEAPAAPPSTAMTPLANLDGQITQEFRSGLEAFREQFEKALGDRIPVDTFIEVATTAWLDTPKLRECSPLSIMRALRKSAQLHLRPDGVEGAVIPYKGKAEFQPMFQGIVRTMLRTRTVKKVEARVVKSGDAFAYGYGLRPVLEHTPGPTDKRGETTHVYAIIWLTNGETQFEVMDRAELDEIQQWAVRQRNGVETPAWKERPDEMRRKIVVKRLSKYVEMDADQAAVLRFDDAVERGEGDVVEVGDLDPTREDRPLEQRVRDHARRQVDDLRRGMERMEAKNVAVAEAVVVEIQDQRVGFGTHQDLTWGALHAKLPGYVTHYVLGEECPWVEEGVKDALRQWLEANGAATTGNAPTVDPAVMAGLLDRGRAAVASMMELKAMSDEDAADAGAEIGLAHHDGNLFALQDAVDELERAVTAKRAEKSGDLFGGATT